MGVARFQFTLAERLRRNTGERAGNTHDSHATSALGGRYCGNGLSRNTRKTGLKTKVTDSKTPH